MKLNESFSASLEAIGEPLRRIDAAGMREITGSDYYLGGLYTPGAVLIQPADYVRAFAAGLATEDRPLREFAGDRAGSSGRRLDRAYPEGAVTAPKVILGVNGLVAGVRPLPRPADARLHLCLDDGALRAGKAGRDRWGLLPADPMGATVRKITGADGSRIVIRTRYTYDPSMQVSEERVAEDRARAAALARRPLPRPRGRRLRLQLGRAALPEPEPRPAFGEVEEGLYSACC